MKTNLLYLTIVINVMYASFQPHKYCPEKLTIGLTMVNPQGEFSILSSPNILDGKQFTILTNSTSEPEILLMLFLSVQTTTRSIEDVLMRMLSLGMDQTSRKFFLEKYKLVQTVSMGSTQILIFVKNKISFYLPRFSLEENVEIDSNQFSTLTFYTFGLKVMLTIVNFSNSLSSTENRHLFSDKLISHLDNRSYSDVFFLLGDFTGANKMPLHTHFSTLKTKNADEVEFEKNEAALLDQWKTNVRLFRATNSAKNSRGPNPALFRWDQFIASYLGKQDFLKNDEYSFLNLGGRFYEVIPNFPPTIYHAHEIFLYDPLNPNWEKFSKSLKYAPKYTDRGFLIPDADISPDLISVLNYEMLYFGESTSKPSTILPLLPENLANLKNLSNFLHLASELKLREILLEKSKGSIRQFLNDLLMSRKVKLAFNFSVTFLKRENLYEYFRNMDHTQIEIQGLQYKRRYKLAKIHEKNGYLSILLDDIPKDNVMEWYFSINPSFRFQVNLLDSDKEIRNAFFRVNTGVNPELMLGNEKIEEQGVLFSASLIEKDEDINKNQGYLAAFLE